MLTIMAQKPSEVSTSVASVNSAQQALGFTFVLLAGTGFGFLGIFGRWAYKSGLTVGELLSFRFALASVLLGTGLLVLRPSFLRITRPQFLISSALGVFGYAVFSTLYFKSIEGISVPLAALLLFTFPVFVNLGAHFILRERMSKRQTLSLLIASCGLGILLYGPLVVTSLVSVIWALLAAVTYAVYVLVSGRYQKDIPPITSSFFVIVASTVTLFLFHRPDLNRVTQLTSAQMLIIIGIAVVSTILPLTFFLAGIQKLSSSKASIIVMIEPVVAAIAAWILLNEQLTPLQSVGAFLVLIALIMNALK